jgi:hypothetical protein
MLLQGNKANAQKIIQNQYPFQKQEIFHRQYTIRQKMKVFRKDGFIDRYSGKKLVNPGILKIYSTYFPEQFPYHKNGKMTEGHISYWEMFPTIDHVIPIAIGGLDNESNWVTTSMLNNSIKSNWTLEQLKWSLLEPGNIEDWDGLSRDLIRHVERDKLLLNDQYIKNWYLASIDIMK